MKTSNKILLSIISIIGLSLLSILIFAKSSLINVENNTVTGDGKIIKVDYNIAEISFFRLSGKYDVYVKKGEPHLVIETDENIQAFLNPDDNNISYYNYKGVQDETPKRTLRIGRMGDIQLNPTTENIKVYLTTPSIEGLDISGTCKVTFEDDFTSTHFRAGLSEFADLNLKVTTDDLKIDAEGQARLNITGVAGNTKIEAKDFSEVSVNSVNAEKVSINSKGEAIVNIVGTSQTFTVDASESTRIEAKSLTTQEAIVKASSQTEVTLSSVKKLAVEATDNAKIKYSGNPEIIKNIATQATLTSID